MTRAWCTSAAGRSHSATAEFVLNDARDSVWVLARPDDVSGIRPGEEVEVSGDVRRLRPDQAVSLLSRLEEARLLKGKADWRILRASRTGGHALPRRPRRVRRGDELDAPG